MCHEMSYEHGHNQVQIGYLDDIEVSKQVKHARTVSTCEHSLRKSDDPMALDGNRSMENLHGTKVDDSIQVYVHGDLTAMHKSIQLDLA